MILPKEYLLINMPFYDTGLFLYPLKTSENHRFSDVFRKYNQRPKAKNGLIFLSLIWLPQRPFFGNDLIHLMLITALFSLKAKTTRSLVARLGPKSGQESHGVWTGKLIRMPWSTSPLSPPLFSFFIIGASLWANIFSKSTIKTVVHGISTLSWLLYNSFEKVFVYSLMSKK